jgi:hypothetical protein
MSELLTDLETEPRRPSRVELDRYGSHKKLCCRGDYVVSARTIIMFVKV